jgi:hypothetical protein
VTHLQFSDAKFKKELQDDGKLHLGSGKGGVVLFVLYFSCKILQIQNGFGITPLLSQ